MKPYTSSSDNIDTGPGDPLFLLWKHCVEPAFVSRPSQQLWQEQTRLLYRLGLGMEETIRFLYHHKPSLQQFEQWLEKNVKIHPGDHMDYDNPDKATEQILSESQMEFWNNNGYILLPGVLTQHECAEARLAIWEFLRASPDDPSSWYSAHEEQRGMMLMFYHHPALQVVRQSSVVRHAFRQLYGHNNIYPTIDKVSFNPPEAGNYTFKGSGLHWDVSLDLPIPLAMQGLLYLNDVSADGGAFHCVPGFHRSIGSWIKALPAGSNPREVAAETLTPEAVEGKAGDFIIWHQALPHCATPNKSNTPRLVQYLTYLPVEKTEEREWK